MNASSPRKSEEMHFESYRTMARSLSEEVVGITLLFMGPQLPETLVGRKFSDTKWSSYMGHPREPHRERKGLECQVSASSGDAGKAPFLTWTEAHLC